MSKDVEKEKKEALKQVFDTIFELYGKPDSITIKFKENKTRNKAPKKA